LIEAIRKEKPENFSQVPVTIEGQEVHKKPFNYLIEYLPIKKRMGFKKIKLFYIFDFDAAWAFTTPDEFEQIVYQRMLEEYPESNHPGIQDLSSPNDLLQLLVENNVAVSTHEDDQGVVLFLRGGMDLAKMISFEGAIGLMLSEQKGFRTGYSIKGKLFNWIETASFFFLKINPADRQEMIRVLGSTYLKVFERDVLKGRIELTTELNSRKLILQGMLDAFPAGFPIQLKGFVNGDFNDKIIRYDSHAGLQLGLFSAQAGLKIHIDKGKLLFSSDLIFANSFWHFSIEHKKENAQEWFRADLAANAFNLLALEGHLRFRRDTRRLQLLGMVSLDFPALKILSVQLDYAGEFNAATGFLSLSAQLGGNSYILSENCRPTGGAAFCIWFNKDPRGDAEAGEKAVSGPRAGDFVLTLGGYHPNFRLPAHYPRVPRLGINWEIDPYTHIRGEAYFAMTPLAVMAGAKLDLVYQRGNIRAWFLAYADFLCQWKPLYYDAKIAVSVGASYTLRVGIRVAGKFIGVTKTFSISIKALFHLYGPPTGGRVEIKLPIVTIGIHFGKPYEPPKPLENWQAFKKQFFDNDKNAAAGAILQIVPQSGVSTIKELADGSTAWIARADELSFMVTTKVPAGKVNGHPEPEKLINIKPLNKVNIGSALTVGLLRDREKIDAFEIQPIKSNVPAALWGSPDADLLDSEKALIPEAITGLHIFPKEAVREASALEIIDQNLGYSEIEAANGKNKLPDPGVVIAPRSPEPGSLEKLGEAIRAATSTRETVAKKLQDLNLFPKTDDLDFAWENLCREMKTDWRHWPDIIDH
ncbi:MAG: hypothetical protein JSW26_17510, partial [Desulfobacterales bacterium]